MKIIQNLNKLSEQNESIFSLVIGNFDGVHEGHLNVIRKIQDDNKRNGLKFVVVTFIPHPSKIIKNERHFLINSYDERRDILRNCHVDYLVELEFNKGLQRLTAEAFFLKFFSKIENLKKIYLGHDFALGFNRSGDIETAKDFFSQRRVKVILIKELKANDNGEISSSKIRRCLQKGAIEKTNELLGRKFFIKGTIVKGKGRGKNFGLPTANLHCSPDRIIPKVGVYFTNIILRNKRYFSLTNIGTNPTFDGHSVKVESHILDFNDNIYGEEANIVFLKRHRDEVKFDNVLDLKLKIFHDIEVAKKYFFTSIK